MMSNGLESGSVSTHSTKKFKSNLKKMISSHRMLRNICLKSLIISCSDCTNRYLFLAKSYPNKGKKSMIRLRAFNGFNPHISVLMLIQQINSYGILQWKNYRISTDVSLRGQSRLAFSAVSSFKTAHFHISQLRKELRLPVQMIS